MFPSTTLVMENSNYSGDFYTVLNMLIFGLIGAAYVGGIVLMIVARVKYPKYLFAKVLMWVYIAMFVTAVATMIISIILLAIACNACINALGGGCPG